MLAFYSGKCRVRRMYEVASLSQFCLRIAAPSPRQRKNWERELPLFVFPLSGGGGVRLHVVNYSFKGPLNKKCTLCAIDFSSAVSGFCQVFIVTLEKCFFRGFGPKADTENSRRTRENPLLPRVLEMMHCVKRGWTTTVVNATDLQLLCYEAPIHYSLIRLLVPCLYVPRSLCQSASTRIARWLPPF